MNEERWYCTDCNWMGREAELVDRNSNGRFNNCPDCEGPNVDWDTEEIHGEEEVEL